MAGRLFRAFDILIGAHARCNCPPPRQFSPGPHGLSELPMPSFSGGNIQRFAGLSVNTLFIILRCDNHAPWLFRVISVLP
jgi:hypothetical protein